MQDFRSEMQKGGFAAALLYGILYFMIFLSWGRGCVMYLAVCDNNKEERDTVLSLLDACQAEHGVTLRRKEF